MIALLPRHEPKEVKSIEAQYRVGGSVLISSDGDTYRKPTGNPRALASDTPKLYEVIRSNGSGAVSMIITAG